MLSPSNKPAHEERFPEGKVFCCCSSQIIKINLLQCIRWGVPNETTDLFFYFIFYFLSSVLQRYWQWERSGRVRAWEGTEDGERQKEETPSQVLLTCIPSRCCLRGRPVQTDIKVFIFRNWFTWLWKLACLKFTGQADKLKFTEAGCDAAVLRQNSLFSWKPQLLPKSFQLIERSPPTLSRVISFTESQLIADFKPVCKISWQ